MAKRVLLTGATGFLGRHLCRALLEYGYTVGAYRRAGSNPASLGPVGADIRWYTLPDQLENPFRELPPYAVIHCAALYGRKGESTAEMIAANTLLPVRLHALAGAHKTPLFIHTGTILEPMLNAYALSKQQAVQWLRLDPGATRVINLKVQHFYGPGDDPTKFVTRMIRQCADNLPEIRLTSGTQRRDFVYISDVTAAFIAVLQGAQREPQQPGFSEMDVGSGSPVTIRQLVEQIHRLTGSRSKLLFGAVPQRPNEPQLTQADTRALQALGWRPAVTLETGLKRTVEAELDSR